MRLRNDLTLRKVGGDFVIVDPSQDMVDMSKVYTFNSTAAWIWEEVFGKEFATEDIKNLLLERYDVSEAIASKDAELLVEMFEKEDLLEKED